MTAVGTSVVAGPGGARRGATAFAGAAGSAASIGGGGDGLDTTYSLSLVVNVYLEGAGPLVVYGEDAAGTGLWYTGSQLRFAATQRTGNATAGGATPRRLELTAGVAAARWYRVAVTYDHNTGKAALYVDGVVVAVGVNAFRFEVDTDRDVHVASYDGAVAHFRGRVACLQVFDRPVDPSELDELSNCPIGRRAARGGRGMVGGLE